MTSRIGERRAAVTGIGMSEIARPSSTSPRRLTVDACLRAIRDAGLKPEDIDGLTSYPGPIDGGGGLSPVGTGDLRLDLALQPDWHGAAHLDGPSPLGGIFSAVQAIAAGLARHVLVFRTVAEASARSQSREAGLWGAGAARVRGTWEYASPMGIVSPAPWYALYAQRYIHEYGLTPEQLGSVAVHARKMAGLNPAAIYRTPITMADYTASRMISSPLRLFDCDVPVDGSVAFVISDIERAKDMPNPPLRVQAIGTAMHGGGLRRPDSLTSFGAESAAAMMWQRSDLSPADVDVAQIYDGFSILTLAWLEALGFCGRGEAGQFVEGGTRIALDGHLPMSTSGGQLSAGRLHGSGHFHEACAQLWQRCGPRQVPGNPRIALSCAGAVGLGCIILARN